MQIALLLIILAMLIYLGYLLYIKDNPYEIVNVSEIKIKDKLLDDGVPYKKMIRKDNFYQQNGIFEDRIILNNDNVLLDGYTTYLLCLHYKIDQIEVIRNKNHRRI